MENIINKKIKKFSNNIFLITENKKIKYKNLLSAPEEKLNFVRKGDLILIVANNTLSFFEIYFFALKRNAPIMLVDETTNTSNLNKIISLYKPNYIFLPTENPQILPKLKRIIYFDFLLIKFSQIKNIINEDLAILLSTSGSTGSSKFVKLSHENIFDNAFNISKYLKINYTHTTITTMPPSYSYGLSIINSHFFQGSKIVINKSSFFDKDFWKKLNENKVTSFGGVPFHFEILRKLRFNKMNFKHLKYLTQAGGVLKSEDINFFLDSCKIKKIKFIQMYGQTEASPRISYLPFLQAKKKIGSIGKVIPGGKMFLKTKKNQKVGEIIYSGKNVFMGYSLNKDDLRKKTRNKQILKTGDFAWKDDQGYYFLVGRKDSFVKISGLRVNLNEIKNLLEKQKIFSEIVKKKEKIVIFTTSSKNQDQITSLIFSEFKLNKGFFKIVKIKKFTRNSRGKVNLNLVDYND